MILESIVGICLAASGTTVSVLQKPAAPKPVRVAILGEVTAPSLFDVQGKDATSRIKAFNEAIKKASFRPYASRNLVLCRANGVLDHLDLDALPENLQLSDGDLVYVPAMNEAVILHGKDAYYVLFDKYASYTLGEILVGLGIPHSKKNAEGPESAPDETAKSLHQITDNAYVYPRFFQRFRTPDLLAQPGSQNLIQRLWFGRPLAKAGSKRVEMMGFYKSDDEEKLMVSPGDLVVLEDSSAYKHIEDLGWKKSDDNFYSHYARKYDSDSKLGSREYLQQFEPAPTPTSGTPSTDDLQGRKKIPSTLGGKDHAALLFGRFDVEAPNGGAEEDKKHPFETSDPRTLFYRNHSQNYKVEANGLKNFNTMIPTFGLSERTNRTEAIALFGTGGNWQLVATNTLQRRTQFLALAGKYGGMRITFRTHPIHAANFMVPLERAQAFMEIGKREVQPSESVANWNAGWVAYEQEGLLYDPQAALSKSSAAEWKSNFLDQGLEYLVFENVLDGRQGMTPSKEKNVHLKFKKVTSGEMIAPKTMADPKKKAGSLIFRVKKKSD